MFVKLTNDSYMLVILDSLKDRNINSIVHVKNMLTYFGKMKNIKIQHLTLNDRQMQIDNQFMGSVCLFILVFCFIKDKEYLTMEE